MIPNLRFIRLIIVLGIVLSALAKLTWATESEWQAGETEWIDIAAEEIGNFEFISDIIHVSHVVLREVSSKQNHKLNVLELKFYA